MAAFEYRLEENLLKLHKELRRQTYRPGKYTSFYIHEPKQRLISASPFRDRVVHHALCNEIEPVFERSFIKDSYANRIGKGTHRAANRCQKFSRKYAYTLQCDLRQFFPAIDHSILRDIISKKIRDKKTMNLIDLILKSGMHLFEEVYKMVYFPGDDLFAVSRLRGLPIGNLTSQFWANVFLNPFDHFIKRGLQCRAYLRYVDDFLLFSNNKRQLWEWKKEIIKRLDRFRLTIHPGAHPKPVSEGIPFLGFIVFPDKRRLKRRKGIYFTRKLRRMFRDFQADKIPAEKITSSVLGWVNHVRFGNTVGLRKAVLGKIFG